MFTFDDEDGIWSLPWTDGRHVIPTLTHVADAAVVDVDVGVVQADCSNGRQCEGTQAGKQPDVTSHHRDRKLVDLCCSIHLP